MKKILVIALAIVVAFAGAAFADANRTFVSLSDVLDGLRGGAEQSAGNSYAMVVYVSGGNEALTSVALDAAGKPLLRGLALNVFAQRIGAGDQSIADFLDSIGGGGGEVDLSWLDGEFWQDGWGEDGLKFIDAGSTVWRLIPDGRGNIWFGVSGNFSEGIGSGQLMKVDVETGEITVIPGAYIVDETIVFDSEGNVIYKEQDSSNIKRYNISTGQIEHIRDDCGSFLDIDSNGFLWTTVYNNAEESLEIVKIDPSTGNTVGGILLKDCTPPIYGATYGINFNEETGMGYLTDSGGLYASRTMYLLDPETCTIETMTYEGSPILMTSITSVSGIDASGNVWYGDLDWSESENAGYLTKYDPVTKETTVFTETWDVEGVTVDKISGDVWFWDWDEDYDFLWLSKYDAATGQIIKTDVAQEEHNWEGLRVDPSGNVWFAEDPWSDEENYALKRYNPSTGEVTVFEGTYMYEYPVIDDNGNVWYVDQAGNNWDGLIGVFCPYNEQ